MRGIGVYEQTQIIFIDTPGIFKPKRRLDRAMVSSAWSGVKDADIVVLVVDAKRGFDDETQSIVAKLNKQKIEAILVLNKVDLIAKEKLLGLSAQINAAGNFKETFMISALTGQNIEDFYKYLADNLPVSPWYYPEEQMSDMPLKLLAAEIVREKLFLYLRQELPYELTVEPELWERREDGSVRAEMTIYVKRDNQKTVPKLVLGQQRQQNTAGAGSEIGYILSNRTIKQFQGLLDNNFRIRTGRQHFFADIELIFVESPAAENFIHRFMSQTFPQHRIEPFPLSGGQFTAEQNRLIGRNAAGRSQQQPSFQPRRFNSGSGKAACHIVQQ